MKNFFIESLLILILGALTSLSLPPFNFYIINFFTFSVFFIFLFKKLNLNFKKKFYFYFCCFFCFSYFLTILYWLTISFTFDKNLSFLLPLALILIPAFLALFYALITFLFYIYNPKNILSAFLYSLFCLEL